MKRSFTLLLALCLTMATMWAQDYVFTFNRTAGTVAVADAEGNVVEGVTATIAVSPDSYLTADKAASDSILCVNQNSASATADNPNRYTLTIKGLPEDYCVESVAFRGVALTGTGGWQGVSVDRKRYFKVSYNEVALDPSARHICNDSHCSGVPTNNVFELAESYSVAGNDLVVGVDIYNGVVGDDFTDAQILGCFYGLTAVTLSGYTMEAVEKTDYTDAIVNAAVASKDGWNVGQGSYGDGLMKYGSGKLVDFNQTITLPAGQYKVTAQAAYRYGGDVQPEYEAIKNGDETHYAKLYAQTATYTYETDVQNRWEGASETDYLSGGSVEVETGKFVPKSSAAVKAWFDNGKYVNEVVFNVQKEGEVKIGIETTELAPAGEYTNIGAWTLTRLGDAEADPKEEEPGDEPGNEPVDVTAQYLTNAGFDDASSWVTEGNVNKEAKAVAGWNVATTNPDWFYGASVGYGSAATVNNAAAPATNPEGVAEGGVLGISVGWGCIVEYTQDVVLPAGVYTLAYKAINVNSDATQAANYFGFKSASASYYGKTRKYEANTWVNDSVTFVLREETAGAISVGIGAVSDGSGANAKLFIDGVTLIYDPELPSEELEPGDVTDQFLTNADFEQASPQNGGTANTPPGWTMKTELSEWIDASTRLSSNPGNDGSQCYNLWAGTVTSADMYQKVNLPAGKYTLSSGFYSDAAGERYVYATVGEQVFQSSTSDVVGTWTTVSVDFFVQTTGEVTLGAMCRDTWFQIDNVKLVYVGEYNYEEVLNAKKAEFTAQWTEFKAYSEESLDNSWNAVNAACFWPVYDEAEALANALDGATEAALEDAMAKMSEAITSVEAAYAAGEEYKFFANALIEVAGASIPFNDEVASAASAAIESSYGAGYSLATTEAIQQAAAEMKAALVSYLSHAAPMEGDAFDLTIFLVNPSFETGNLTGWTVRSTSADTGVRENTGDHATNGTDGKYLFNSWWNGVYLTQEAEGLPNGAYRLTVAMSGGDDGNPGTAYIIANQDTLGLNVPDKTVFVDHSLDFEVTDGKLHIATVGGNDDDTAENPVGSFNQGGYWWYKSDNYRLAYVPVIPDSVRYKIARNEFVQHAQEFGSFVESNASLSMLSGIKGAYAWPVFDVVDPLVASIDEVTDMELLDSMITVMDAATDTMLLAVAVYDEYMVYRNLLWDAADVSTGFTEEVEAAKDMALENSNYACMMVATIEGLEEKVAEIKGQYLAYVGNAWGDKEGVTFDVTFMAGVTPRAGDKYDAATDAWSAGGTSADAPEVTTADGRTVKMIEYNTRVGKEKLNSVVMQQTIWNLPNATYNVELYANAISRNYEVAWAEGADPASFVYVSANDAKTPVVAKVAAEMTESEVYAINGAVVTDGSLHLTLSKNDVDGTNWHTIQIKSVVIVAPVKPVADTYADFFVTLFEGDELVEFSSADLIIFDLVENVELSGEVHATLTTPSNAEGETLVASHYLDEEIPEEPCHIITFEGTQVYTEPGAYTLTIPEGLFTVDGAPNAAAVVNFTIKAPVVVEFEAKIESVTPAVGEVTELSEIIVQFDSDIVRPYSNVFVTNEDGTEFEFELDPNHGDVTQARYFAKDGAITAAGTYTFDCSQIDHLVNRLTRERIYPFTGTYTWTIKSVDDGINNINADTNAVIYDIHGRRVTEMTKGIYIVNGRKVIKK